MRTLSWTFTALAAIALVFNYTHGLNINIFWFLLFLSPIILGFKLKKEKDEIEQRVGEDKEKLRELRGYFETLVKDIYIPSSDRVAKGWYDDTVKESTDKVKVEKCISNVRDLARSKWEKESVYNTVVEYLHPKTWDDYGKNPRPYEVKGRIDKMVREHADQRKALNVIQVVMLEGKKDHVKGFPPFRGRLEEKIEDPHAIKKGVVKLDECKTEIIEQLQHEKRNLLEKLRDKSN